MNNKDSEVLLNKQLYFVAFSLTKNNFLLSIKIINFVVHKLKTLFMTSKQKCINDITERISNDEYLSIKEKRELLKEYIEDISSISMIDEIKIRIAENNKITINNIDCLLSVENLYACNDCLTFKLVNHSNINSIHLFIIEDEIDNMNFEVNFKDTAKFLNDNKDFTNHLLNTGHNMFIYTKDTISVDNIFNTIITDIFNNKNCISILTRIKYNIKFF